MHATRLRKPYGVVKNFGEFVVVSDPNTKIPLHNFDNWNKFSSWLKTNKKSFKGNLLF